MINIIEEIKTIHIQLSKSQEEFPNRENAVSLTKLDEDIMWLENS